MPDGWSTTYLIWPSEALKLKKKKKLEIICNNHQTQLWSDLMCSYRQQCCTHCINIKLDTSDCLTQMPDCKRMFVQSVVLLTSTGDCRCSCSCMEYDTAGRKNNEAAFETVWTTSWSEGGKLCY
ncbi:uncharacterized [Lates japonicus]